MHENPDHRMDILQLEATPLDKSSVPHGRPIANREPFELTNELYIGISLIPPECPLHLLDMYAVGGSIQIGIDHTDQDHWMRLEGLVTGVDGTYIALAYAPDCSEKLENDLIVALRLADKQLMTLTAEEFESVRYELHISVQKRMASDRDYVESILGTVRDWKD